LLVSFLLLFDEYEGILVKNIVILFASFFFVLCTNVNAEIHSYQSSDNTGLNKKERIDTVEKYLADLSTSLKSMENKLDENAKKLKVLEDVVKKLNDLDRAKMNAQLGEQKSIATGDQGEMEKLKADILSLKNKDIEKLKTDLSDLTDTVKALQSTIRSQN